MPKVRIRQRLRENACSAFCRHSRQAQTFAGTQERLPLHCKKRVTYQKRYTVCKNICTLLNIYTIMLNAMSTIPGKYKREFIASTILLRNLKRYSPKNMSLT